MIKDSFHYNKWKFSFTPWIINIWNSLPNHVIGVDSIDIFKSRFDKFWLHQDVSHDYKLI